MKDWEKFLILLGAIVFGLWLYGTSRYGVADELTPAQIFIMNQ